MTYFKTCKTLNEVKAEYKILAKQYHSDVSGYDTTAIMQEINKEYSYAIAKIAKGGNLSTEDIESEILNAEAYKNAVSVVTNLPGITVELCGGWLWIGGNTYPVRNALKEAGFYFASAKKMWYFRTAEYAVRSHKSHSIDEIRTKYGSQVIGNHYATKLL